MENFLRELGQLLVKHFPPAKETTKVMVSPTVTVAEHYSQGARDRRQWPVLALFAPLNPDSNEILPWQGAGGVREVAQKNGFTDGVGGLFNSLLAWTDEHKTHVRITEAGRKRFREIEARAGVGGQLLEPTK